MAVFNTGTAGTADYLATVDTVVPPPTNISDGDILLLTANAVAIGAEVVLTPPAGFASVNGATDGIVIQLDPASEPAGVGYLQLFAWWKRASSESGDYTITHDLLTAGAAIMCYRGSITSGDPTSFAAATGNADYGPGDITATGGSPSPGSMVVYLSTTWGDEIPGATPSGLNPRFTYIFDGGLGFNNFWVADGAVVNGLPTGDKIGANVTTGGWAAALIFITSAPQNIVCTKA